MKKFGLILMLLACVAFLFGPVLAQAGELSGSVTLASDYIARGTDQTGRQPALQGALEYQYGGINADGFVSNLGIPGDPSTTELDFTTGYRNTLNGWYVNVAYTKTIFLNDTPEEDMDEYKVVLGHDVRLPLLGTTQLRGGVFVSPDYSGTGGKSLYGEVYLAKQITDELSGTAYWGRQTIENGQGFNNWNVGLTYQLKNNLALSVNYNDTSRHDISDEYSSRVYGALTWSF